MKYILIVVALVVAWYAILFMVPRNKRGITNAICSIIFGCSMIGMAVHGFGN